MRIVLLTLEQQRGRVDVSALRHGTPQYVSSSLDAELLGQGSVRWAACPVFATAN